MAMIADDCRNIPIARFDPDKGEQMAQAYDIAYLRQLVSDFPFKAVRT